MTKKEVTGNPYADLFAKVDEIENQPSGGGGGTAKEFDRLPWLTSKDLPNGEMVMLRFLADPIVTFKHKDVVMWKRKFDKEQNKFVGLVKEAVNSSVCLCQDEKWPNPDRCPECRKQLEMKEDPAVKRKARRPQVKDFVVYHPDQKKFFRTEAKQSIWDAIRKALSDVTKDGKVLKKGNYDILDFTKGCMVGVTRKLAKGAPLKDTKYECEVLTDCIEPVPEEFREEYEAHLAGLRQQALQRYDYTQLNTLIYGTEEEAQAVFDAASKTKAVTKETSVDESDVQMDDIPF